MYKVYRNLNNGKLSIQYKGLVIGHADSLMMLNVVFKVNQKGRERVIKEKKKNVHAFVIGDIACCEGFKPFKNRELKRRETYKLHEYIWYRGTVVYNPFKFNNFKLSNDKFKLVDIYTADRLDINKNGNMTVYNMFK